MTETLEGPVVPRSLDLPTPAEFYSGGTEAPSGGGKPPEPSVGFAEYRSLPKTLPAWYAPGYFTEANMRRQYIGLEKAGYGVPQGPDYTNTTMQKYHRSMLERRIEDGSLDPGRVTATLERLVQQNPLASPDALLGYALSGAPVDPNVMAADAAGYADLMGSMQPLPAGNSLVTAQDGYVYDRTAAGTVTLPDGRQYETSQGDVVVRDLYGEVAGVVPANQQEERFNFGPLNWLKTAGKAFFYTLSMPYEGLVGAARNVGASLGEGNYGEAALDVLGYLPMVAGVRELVEGDAYINPWEQTYMGQMILANARGERLDVGTGWFISEDSDIFQRQLEAVTGAYEVDGNAWTIGRGLAGALDLDPNALSYRVVSGIADFTSAVLLDPTVWVAGLGVPSKVAKGVTSTQTGARAVRGARSLVGKDPGTGVLEFGMARREAAKLDARKLRVANELPRARTAVTQAQERLAKANLTKEQIAEENRLIGEAQARVADLEAEALTLFREGEALRLVGDIEDATEGRLAAFREQQELATRDRIAGRKPYLSSLSAQRREAESRLSILEEVETLGSRLQTITGRGAPEVGSTVTRGKTDWTVTEVGDQIVLTSPKGARRKMSPEDFAAQYPTATSETAIHSREQIRLGLMNLTARNAPEQVEYEVNGLSSLTDLPGDVTVTVPGVSLSDEVDLRVGNLDGDGMVAAWTGDSPPVLVQASQNVPSSVVDRLFERLTEKVVAVDAKEQARLRRLAQKVGPNSAEYQEALVESWVRSESLSDDLLTMLANRPTPARALEPEVRAQPPQGWTPGDQVAVRGYKSQSWEVIQVGGGAARHEGKIKVRLPSGFVRWVEPEALSPITRNVPETTPGSTFSLESTPISPVDLPTPTWGDLLDMLNQNGLASYLERVLREDGYDGISGLLTRSSLDTDGVWWGYNQNIASYRARLGALADDPDLRLSSNPAADVDQVALVMADEEGVSAEISRLQGTIADLEARKASVLDNADRLTAQDEARAAQIPQEVERLDALIEKARQRWAVLAPKLTPIPNYTRAERTKRIEGLKRKRTQVLGERARLIDVSRKEAQTFEEINQRIQKATDTLQRRERILEGFRMEVGADLDEWGRGAVNFDSAERFLFGGATEGAVSQAGRFALSVMARETNPAKLHAMTRNKWPDELVREVVDLNRLDDDAFAARFPESVADPDTARAIREGTMTADEAAVRGVRELTGDARTAAIRQARERQLAELLASNVGTRIRSQVGSKGVAALAPADEPHPGPSKYTVKMRQNPWLRRQVAQVPSAVKVDLQSPKDTYVGVKKYLDLAKVPEDEQWALLGKLWDSSEAGVAANARNIVTEAFDLARDRLVQQVADEMQLPTAKQKDLDDAINQATRVYVSGQKDATFYWRSALGDLDAPIKIKMSDGSSMPMTGAQLESELANGALFLPDPEQFRRVVRRAAPLLGKGARKKDDYEILGGTADAVNRLFSDYWRSFMLLRPAYVVRNIMEMQVRNFLSGSLNIVNNPMATLAMVLGPSLGKRNAVGAFGRTLEPYANDVFGYRFGFRNLADTDAQASAIEAYHAEYLEILRTDRALVDLRMYTGTSAKRAGRPQLYGQKSPRFVEGWSEELMLLRSSPMARIVAGNVPDDMAELIKKRPDLREDLITEYIFKGNAPGTRIIHDLLGDAGPEYQAMLRDRNALKDFLFGPANENSVQRRIDDMTGGNEHLRQFVATGDLRGPTGEALSYKGGIFLGLADRRAEAQQELQNLLSRNFKGHADVALPRNVRVWLPENQSDSRNAVDKFLDAFFKVATRAERVGVMGPEWRFVYWETIRDLAPDLDLRARDALLKNMEKTGLTLRSNGTPLGRMKQGHKVLKNANGNGTLTLTDAHRIAADAASDEVRALYYDAHKRRQFWHASRLAIPFGQAWADTIATWARLSAQNPVQLYKAMRGFNAAIEDGSNVVYEASDWAMPSQESGWFESPEGDPDAANWYDPNQGFMYRDARNGSYMANIPMLGHIGTAMANLPGPLGGSAGLGAGQMESAFRIENLNLAFGGGSALPGIGPALSVPLSPLMSSAQGTAVGEFLYDWLYPVGEPDLSRSIFDQILPAAARRLQSAMFDPNSPFVMANMKAAVNFLAADGDYNMYDQSDRQRLLDDAMRMSKRLATVTAVGQFILPTVPTSVWVGTNPDNKRIGLAAAASLYYEGYRSMYDDSDQAQLAFARDYGEQYLATIVGTTKGDRVIGEEAFAIIKDNLDLGRAYPEELAFLFPMQGNDFTSFAFQQEELRRRRLTPREFLDEFWAYTARSYKAQAARNAIVSGKPEDAYKADVQYINDQIERAGGVPIEFRQGAVLIESTMAMLNKAPDSVLETENSQVFLQLYSWREALKNKARMVNGENSDSLGTQAMRPYTLGYLNQLAEVERNAPQMRQLVAEFRREVS